MLENEEVDDDYFTPIAKTSLASIFKKPYSDDKTENETLKYTPPSPKSTQSHDEAKVKRTYEYIFSCVFNGFLWIDNVYTHKGKLGCTVVKLTTDSSVNFHSVLLYDSNRTTVSSTMATKELVVTVKGNEIISYYDSYQKYWCLYGLEDDIKKIIEIFNSCNVNVKVLKDSDNVFPEQIKSEMVDVKMENTSISNLELEQETTKTMVNKFKKNIGSDTDSSVNRKTKASILNRMANMGQSVLPPHSVSNELSSYSSDSNESDNHIAAVRSKPSIMKKNTSEKNLLQLQKNNVQKKSIAPRIQHSMENKIPAVVNDQLMPLQSSSIITTTSGNDLSFFITEQRIANSELRINMTRMTDKVDHILNKLDNIEIKEKEGTANINTDILQKLLKEYECKIKTYEELLKKVDTNTNMNEKSTLTSDFVESAEELILKEEIIMLRNKIVKLNECIIQRDDNICLLNRQIENLKTTTDSGIATHNKDELLIKISELEQLLSIKDDMLAKVTAKNDELSKTRDDQLENKIKTIMNDTFQAAAANFNSSESYSGEEICNTIAAVIKKVTIQSLQRTT